MRPFTIPPPRTPVTDRIASLFSAEWYKFLSLMFSASNNGYRVVDSGFVALVAGTATVTSRQASSANGIHLTRNTSGGTPGHLSVGTITTGISFVINSTSGTETSEIFWSVLAPIT